MSKKLNGLLGVMVMLALAFGFAVVGPVDVAAEAGPGNCQWAFGQDPDATSDDALSFNGFTAGECEEFLYQFGTTGQIVYQGEELVVNQSGAGGFAGTPGTACQISIANGNVVVQGNCFLSPQPTEVPPTEVPGQTPTTPAETPTTPAETPTTPAETPTTPAETPTTPAETPVPTKPGEKLQPTEEGGKAEPETEVTALPTTGSGTSDGAGLLTAAAVAAAALTGVGALKIRNKR